MDLSKIDQKKSFKLSVYLRIRFWILIVDYKSLIQKEQW